MFAVPGWSVSSSGLKAETEQSSRPSPQAKANGHDDSATPAPVKSKKRKRGNDANGQVTKANVDQMFRKHIEGLEAKASQNDKKQKKRKAQEDTISPDGEEATEGGKNGKALPSQHRAFKNDLNQQNKANNGSEDAPSDAPKKKKKKGRKNKDKSQTASDKPAAPEAPPEAALPMAPPAPSNLTPLQQAMRQKLLAGRFRHLNETLYTTPSSHAVKLFEESPELFAEYHAGFTRQVQESWPSNPVDGYIQAIKTRGAIKPPRQQFKRLPRESTQPLPRRPDGGCRIADLGCGDAKIARSLQDKSVKNLKLRIDSFDLQSPHPAVTKADISNLPVQAGTVDVAIFCLSLMGTNWVSFIEEAWRVLRSDGKGELWISEVKSRFGKVTRKGGNIGMTKNAGLQAAKKDKKKKKADEDDDALDEEIFVENAAPSPVGADDDETDISAFVDVIRSRGFILKNESVDKSNKMFARMEFLKLGQPTKGPHVNADGMANRDNKTKKKFLDSDRSDKVMTLEEETKVLKPCVYKTR